MDSMGRSSTSRPSRARFESEPSSVRAARRFVAGAVDDVAVDRDAVILLTSELAANAVRHARTAFDVVVNVAADSVRVEVVNDAPGMLVIAKQPTTEGGRGTQILDALAAQWGVRAEPQHKTVWFECERGGQADGDD
jgi:two-component sensor histidine kinase